MTNMPPFVLNFHGIGEPSDEIPDAEKPYWVSSSKFKQLIELIVRLRTKFYIEITFDDGNLSDFVSALPILASAKLRATFFVLADRIGHCNYLSPSQMLQMKKAGMEIGLHGARHVDWTGLNASELDRELSYSRGVIAAASETDVKAVAIPFGRYNGRVLKEIATRGFERIYTSDRGVRLFCGSVRSRFSVREDFDPNTLSDLIEHKLTFTQRCLHELKFQYKRLR